MRHLGWVTILILAHPHSSLDTPITLVTHLLLNHNHLASPLEPESDLFHVLIILKHEVGKEFWWNVKRRLKPHPLFFITFCTFLYSISLFCYSGFCILSLDSQWNSGHNGGKRNPTPQKHQTCAAVNSYWRGSSPREKDSMKKWEQVFVDDNYSTTFTNRPCIYIKSM